LWDQGIEVALASAATTDLGAQTTNFVNITGTTTITSFGTTYKGPRFVRFAGALLLTHNASTLILPTGANITTAAGDSCVIVPKATSGTADGWKVEAYQKADGTALSLPAISQSNIAAGYGLIPTGTLLDFGGTSAPTGFLGCDGAAVSRTTYATLFTAIGTTWGVGDGSTTFNVPNFQRRVAVGSGGSGTATLANSVGSTGGAETHTLVTGEMPAHTHDLVGYVTGSNTGVGTTSVSVSGGVQGATNSTGGGGAHNNMQPSAVILKIIKT
jgi:microcystin-dependent protein